MGFDVGATKGKVRPSINVAPLVDVVLVLLIIFMVITPLMTKQVSVNVPVEDQASASEPPPQAEPQVVLRVLADGSVYINKQPLVDAELDEKLKRVFAIRKDRTLFFDAAETAEYGRAVEVLDLARGAGIATIAVLTEPLVATE